MRVLITGVTGLVGSHLAAYLAGKQGVEVCALKRWRSDVQNIRSLRGKIRLYEGDMEDGYAVSDLVGTVKPDCIYHLAAQSYPNESWGAPVSTLMTNVIGTVHLLEAVKRLEHHCKVLMACSSAEYGFVREEEVPIREDHPLRPLTPYGVSKVAQELLGLQYHANFGLPIFITRSFNIIGPGQGDRCSVQTFARQIAEVEKGYREPIVYVGNLEPARDFSDVRDVIRALWLLPEEGKPGEVYNLCSGRAVKMRTVLETLLSFTKETITVKQDPARLRPSDEPILLGDQSKLKAHTGWEPEIPFHETLRWILDYWRETV